MSAHLGRKGGTDGPIQLEKTGPFVPPITFPGIGDIIVTDEMKQQMEKAGFRGIAFRPVEKTRIVEVPWHEWDLTAAEPDYYPEGGEPEATFSMNPILGNWPYWLAQYGKSYCRILPKWSATKNLTDSR
jgi:hypothetical protein